MKAKLFLAAIGIGMMMITLALPAGVHAQNQVFARAYPALWSGSPVDHTYVCFNGSGNSCSRYSTCFSNPGGGTSGGNELSGTSGYGNGGTARCRVTNPSCVISLTNYGSQGVCHQAANRGLSVIGRTVSAARGYGFMVAWFGPYGRWGWSGCQTACPAAMCYA
jgi:hypothetical protein